jgi:hypothetical protein
MTRWLPGAETPPAMSEAIKLDVRPGSILDHQREAVRDSVRVDAAKYNALREAVAAMGTEAADGRPVVVAVVRAARELVR